MGLGNYELSERVIAAAIRVHRELGPGFLEVMYEEALSLELATAGLSFERQKLLPVFYREHLIGDAQPLKVRSTFRRDEFPAKLCPREFLLFCQQDSYAARGQVNRRAGAGRPAAGNDHVILIRTTHKKTLKCLESGYCPTERR